MAESITIIDNRTGQSIEIPLEHGGVAAAQWAKLLPGIWFYDPGLLSTAVCESSITFVDGEAGVLRYRGYPIEELAEQASFIEVAYLLLFGRLPTEAELASFGAEIAEEALIPEPMLHQLIGAFPPDAHPMATLSSGVAALAGFYPDARDVSTPEQRRRHAIRLIAKVPTIAAASYRHSRSLPYIYPTRADYVADFMAMMWQLPGREYNPDPIYVRALDILFILQADHEQNCSTTTMRTVASSLADPYLSCAAACAALSGPRHGGANEAVIRMLEEISSPDRVADFVAEVKSGHGRLQGFGHRVYKNYDPRAKIIKEVAYQVLGASDASPLFEVALKLEEVALKDEYFLSRRLYPNVDFYSGLIYRAIGFPAEMFTVLFAIARTAGWLAHWMELLDQNAKLVRPRQLYTGEAIRHYVPLSSRG